LLAANQRASFSVVVPMDADVWRAPVLWGFMPTRLDLLRAVCQENWLAIQAGRSLPGLSVGVGTWHTNFTPEMKP
jgi:hypothetical protein